MNERTRRYLKEGREEAKRLFPLPECLCICGKEKVSDRHHVDANTHNNQTNNVVFYCHKCHLRIERQNSRVGNHTKLTQEQISRIKTSGEEIGVLAAELCYDPGSLRRIRNGERTPVPYSEIVVPYDWVDNVVNGKQVRFRSQALSADQVKELRSYMFMRRKLAEHYAKQWNVTVSTIYKAKGGYGGYAHPRFNPS